MKSKEEQKRKNKRNRYWGGDVERGTDPIAYEQGRSSSDAWNQEWGGTYMGKTIGD